MTGIRENIRFKMGREMSKVVSEATKHGEDFS